MPKKSAGIVVYRRGRNGLEFLLVHPGGPYWERREHGAWSVPKGEYEAGEDAFGVACRELEEETGMRPAGDFIPLSPVRQRGGKVVTAWAVEGDFDPRRLRSNTFTMEWPPGSGRLREFPEVDRAGWFTLEEAERKVNPAHMPLLEELSDRLSQVRSEDG